MSDVSQRSILLAANTQLQEKFYALAKFWMMLLIFCIILSSTLPVHSPQTATVKTTAVQTVLNTKAFVNPNIAPYVKSSICIADINPTKSLGELSNVSETLEEPQSCTSEVILSTDLIPESLYLHFYENSDSRFYWVPEALEAPLSPKDIRVDFQAAIDSDFSCELSEYFQYLVSLVVYREAGNQPFLGQLMVAEDVIGRIRYDNSWDNIYPTLIEAYEAKLDENGKLHIYLGKKEILEPSESVQEAVQLALSGSRVTALLLEAVTDTRNEQYGWQLDDIYYSQGALFHYNPESICNSEAQLRTINLVPVSFQFSDHIFYGHWLSELNQLEITNAVTQLESEL